MKNIKLKEVKLEGAMLTTIQKNVVKTMIVDSMSVVYTQQGVNPGKEFYETAGLIADEIIEKTQMVLIQEAVFDGIVKKSASKTTKKVVKKVTKKAPKKVTKKVVKKPLKKAIKKVIKKKK